MIVLEGETCSFFALTFNSQKEERGKEEKYNTKYGSEERLQGGKNIRQTIQAMVVNEDG